MKLQKIVKSARELASPYAVSDGRRFRLKDFDPGDTGPLKAADKPRAAEALRDGIDAMADLQDKLYAQDRWSLLLIFQGMDAAGKDSAIKSVFDGVNPQGCEVTAFKVPSTKELEHDFLWRATIALPERGRIGIFNRSYYEEVLVARVHPEILQRQQLPPASKGEDIWKRRFREINDFERYLVDNGILVLKIFLYVSKAEQKKRFLERIERPEKNWKFSASDVAERAFWKDYMAAYEDVFAHTSTDWAPWYVIPADNKWFTRLAVSAVIVAAMREINPQYPTLSKEHKTGLLEAKKTLEQEE